MVEINQNCSSLENVATAALHKPLVVVGIPAFNEEKTIARVVLGAQKYAHIVVVCDDGSSDLTGEIADRLVRTVGVSLAQKMSGLAVGWGNCSASAWALDRGFARYLALCVSPKVAT